MVNGVLNCARPLLWALVLIVALTYMTAVVILQISSDYLRALPDTQVVQGGGSAQTVEFINDKFSSIGEAMYELFKSLTGGSDWGDTADPLFDISYLLVAAYILYIVLGVFCMLNLVTAVFLEAADRTTDLQEEAYAKRDWISEAKEFFTALVRDVVKEDEGDSARRLNKDEFIKVLKHRKTLLFLEGIGVDLFLDGGARLDDLFTLIDVDGNGDIDINEFVSSLYQLKGAARSLDVKLEHQKTIAMIGDLQESLRQLRRNPTSPRLSLRPGLAQL